MNALALRYPAASLNFSARCSDKNRAGRLRHSSFARFSLLCLLMVGVVLASVSPLHAAEPAATFRAQHVVFPSYTMRLFGVDGQGNIYGYDQSGDQVLRLVLNPDGTYTTWFVMKTQYGFWNSYAVDVAGNVYVLDPWNFDGGTPQGGRVLKETLQSTGVYTEKQIGSMSEDTVPVFNAIAVDPNGNVYFADYNANVVWSLMRSGSNYSPGVVATGLNNPEGIAVDGSGNVYINDAGNSRLLKETPTGNGSYSQSVVESNVSLKIEMPNAVPTPAWSPIVVDSAGNIYAQDSDNNVVEWSPSAGGAYVRSKVVDGASGLGAVHLAVDPNGNLYVSYYENGRLCEALPAGTSVNLGTVPVRSSSQEYFFTFWFTAPVNLQTYRVLTMGAIPPSPYLPDFVPVWDLGATTTFGPQAIGDAVMVHVQFTPQHPGIRIGAITLVDSGGNLVGTAYLSGIGTAPQITYRPTQTFSFGAGYFDASSVAVDGGGNIYVTETSNNRVLKLNYASGMARSTVADSTAAFGLQDPHGVAVDGSGNVYIADSGNNRVVKETPAGSGGYAQSVVVDTGLQSPGGVAVDGSGNVFVADTYNDRVIKETLTTAGTYTESVIADGLSLPAGVAVDGSGNVYIADTGAGRIVKETPSSGGYTESTVASNLSVPFAIAIDGVGNVYVSDTSGRRVLLERMTPGGVYAEEVIAAAGANELNSPQGLAVSATGTVYVAEPNSPLWVVETGSKPYLYFGAVTVGNTSAARSVPLINSGNATLTATNLTLPAGFTKVAGSGTPPDCTTNFSLAPGAACNISIEFTPVSAQSGPISGAITAQDNDLNVYINEQLVGLGGNASQPAVSFALSGPDSKITGTPFTFTVTARDSAGGTASGYWGTVHFTSSDPAATLPPDYAFTSTSNDNGVRQFSGTLVTPGNQTIIATDVSNPSLTGTVTIPVASNLATRFEVSAPASATAGTPLTFTVRALDPYNNTQSSYSGTVHFSSTTSAMLPADTTLVNGIGTFSATLYKAGSRTISATDTGNPLFTGTSGAITVSPGTVKYVFPHGPDSATEAIPFSLTVTAEDQFHNIVTSYRGTVHFTCNGDDRAVLPADYTFTAADNGVHTFTGVTLFTVGNPQIVVTDAASGISGATNIGVGSGPTNHFTLYQPASILVGRSFTFTLLAVDVNGYQTQDYTGTVHFSSSDTQAVLPADYTFVAADGGMHVFTATLNTLGAQTMTVTDVANPSLTAGGNISVIRMATTTGVQGPAGTLIYGQNVNLYVTVSWIVPTMVAPTGNVTISVGGTQLGQAPVTSYTSTSATANFSISANNFPAGNNVITATYSGDATYLDSSGTATVTIAAYGDAVTQSIVSGTPQAAPIQAAFATPLVLQVTDLYNNPVPGVRVDFAETGCLTGQPHGMLSLAPAGVGGTGGTVVTQCHLYEYTDSNGKAAALVTANGVPGSHTAVAHAYLMPYLNFELTNLSGNVQSAGAAAVGQPSPPPTTLWYSTPSGTPNFALHYGIEFSAGTPSCTGSGPVICSVAVTFQPKYAGMRRDAMVVTDGSGKVLQTTLLSALSYASAVAFTPGVIDTVAGGGTGGDGGPAKDAQLSSAVAVALDSAGDLYLVDQRDSKVRKVDANTHSISTVVGGDSGGDPVKVVPTSYEGIAVDGAGNLYISDSLSDSVIKVSADGATVTRVAGIGSAGYRASDDGGPATSAQLDNPRGVAVDGAGNLYIADTMNQRIRKIDGNTGLISTVAGNGTAGYRSSDDGGAAVSAELSYPTGVALDDAGNLYIADSGNNRIRKVDANTRNISTVAGNGISGYRSSDDGGPALSAELNNPMAVTVDSAGDLYVADAGNHLIRKIDTIHNITTLAGVYNCCDSNNWPIGGFSGDTGLATSAALNSPTGLALDGTGNLYIADGGNARIRRVDVTSPTLSFGTVMVGQTSDRRTMSMSEIGNLSLNVYSVDFAGDFQPAENGCQSGNIQVGWTCVLGVRFAPTAPGDNLTGTVTLTDDAPDTPQTVQLRGTGTGAPPVFTPAAANVVFEATSPQGAVVTFTPAATTWNGNQATVTCNPASGSQFAFGLTSVNCTATDPAASSLTTNAQFYVSVTDKTAPSLQLPTLPNVTATGPTGAPVTYSATATDLADPNPAVSCAPASGAVFPIGTTTVACTATDQVVLDTIAGNSGGNQASGNFKVTVVASPPVFASLPLPNVVVEATSPTGTVATFSLPTAGNQQGPANVACTPASGSTFQLGPTLVTCKATDPEDASLSTTATFTVSVRDTTSPTLHLPAAITSVATGTSGATVNYPPATANDVADGTLTPVCTPASGTIFPVGVTTVTCTATDRSVLDPTGGNSGGNTSTGTFTVTISDFSLEQIPALTLLVGTTGTAQVNIYSRFGFNSPVMLTVSGPTTVVPKLDSATVTPAAGGMASTTLSLPLTPAVIPGTLQFTVTGTVGTLTHSVTFDVTVNADYSSVTNVIGQIYTAGGIDSSALSGALATKLSNAQAYISAGDTKNAKNALNALLNQIAAQSGSQGGKHILSSATYQGVTFNPAMVLSTEVNVLMLKLQGNPDPIVGNVVNAMGVGIPGAVVSISDSSGNIVGTAVTDATGFYFVAATSALNPGSNYTAAVTGIPAGYLTSDPAQAAFTWQAVTTTINFMLK